MLTPVTVYLPVAKTANTPVTASFDRYAVAMKKEGTITGHLTRKLLQVCSLFLRQGGTQSQV